MLMDRKGSVSLRITRAKVKSWDFDAGRLLKMWETEEAEAKKELGKRITKPCDQGQ